MGGARASGSAHHALMLARWQKRGRLRNRVPEK
jgi:hypothetical protein